MNTRTTNRWWGLALAGITAASGCASIRGRNEAAESGNPTAQRTAASQKESEQALKRAADAQKKAQDQANEAAKAQADVQKAQQALVTAQDKAQVEQQKAQQAQAQANQARQEASRTTEVSQAQASQALEHQGQQIARHQQSTAGQVTESSADHVGLRQPDGSTMTFRVTPQTRVLLDGKPSQARWIAPGANAQVSYQLSGGQPLALSVTASTGNPATNSTGSAAEPAPREPAAPPAPQDRPPADQGSQQQPASPPPAGTTP